MSGFHAFLVQLAQDEHFLTGLHHHGPDGHQQYGERLPQAADPVDEEADRHQQDRGLADRQRVSQHIKNVYLFEPQVENRIVLALLGAMKPSSKTPSSM